MTTMVSTTSTGGDRELAEGADHWLSAAHWTAAVVNNGLGRYGQALAAAEQGCDYPDELGLATWSKVELIEAAARAGCPERAAEALKGLSAAASALGTDWALGIEARSRALLSSGARADRLYREALSRLARTRVTAELGGPVTSDRGSGRPAGR
jgi:hypothetical protein